MGVYLDRSVVSKVPIAYKLDTREDPTRLGSISGISDCRCQTTFIIPRVAYADMLRDFNEMRDELPQNIRRRIKILPHQLNTSYVPPETRDKYYRVYINESGYESGIHQELISAIKSISGRLVAKLNAEGHTAIKASLRK